MEMRSYITREQARHLSDAAYQKAGELGVDVTVAVCDPSGRPVFLERGDSCGFLTPETAMAKARAAAAFGKSTKELVDLQGSNPAFWQALPGAMAEQVLPTTGAVPVVTRNMTIGAIGCAGGTPDQDHACALAGAFAVRPTRER